MEGRVRGGGEEKEGREESQRDRETKGRCGSKFSTIAS